MQDVFADVQIEMNKIAEMLNKPRIKNTLEKVSKTLKEYDNIWIQSK